MKNYIVDLLQKSQKTTIFIIFNCLYLIIMINYEWMIEYQWNIQYNLYKSTKYIFLIFICLFIVVLNDKLIFLSAIYTS